MEIWLEDCSWLLHKAFSKSIETEKVGTVVDSRKTTAEALQQVRGRWKFICC